MRIKGLLILLFCGIILTCTTTVKERKAQDCEMLDYVEYLECVRDKVISAVERGEYNEDGFKKIKCDCKKIIEEMINENRIQKRSIEDIYRRNR